MLGVTQNHAVAGDHRRAIGLALVALALAAAVFVLVLTWTEGGNAPTGAPIVQDSAPAQTLNVTPNAPRYDGGPEEGSRGPGASTAPNPGRPDGGPEEGTAAQATK